MRKRIIMTLVRAGIFGATGLAALPAMAQSASATHPAPSSIATSNPNSSGVQQLLDGAAKAVKDMRSQPHYNDLVARSKGMFIIPPMTEGALGKLGQGVLVSNTPDGWSQPAFLTIRRMSQGSQANAKAPETIMLLMTSKATEDFRTADDLSVGPDSELAVINYSGQAKVPVNGGDVIVWSNQAQPFSNTIFHATDIIVNKRQDQQFYGKAVTAAQILDGDVSQKSAADNFSGVLTP